MTAESLTKVKEIFADVFAQIGKVVVGQQEVIRQMVIAILCNANVLVEGYPGLAKTLSVRTLAQLMDMKFSRIQGTPDLMPSDITGTYVLEEGRSGREFKFQHGPIFANIVLMDEVNRSTPKTQSALLEAMQERQVTVGNTTFKLEEPFFVLATQNPVEQEGTYVLAEAQSDRFLFKIKATYPTAEEEMEIVNRMTESSSKTQVKLQPIISKAMLAQLQELVRRIPVANDIKRYAIELINKTRKQKELIEYGASPRASIGLILAAKANALLEGRNFVTKQDIDLMAFPILRHRIILNFEAERNNFDEDDVVKYLLR
ncbi:MAG: MoxR family ATPase [Nanoarchaeota archaeon]